MLSCTGFPLAALDDILRDMDGEGAGGGLRMFRLLQGDVGSGKTAVAFLSMLKAAEQGTQSCMLAPTEVLTMQHLHTLRSMAAEIERHDGRGTLRVDLLTGGIKGKARQKLLDDVRSGEVGRERDDQTTFSLLVDWLMCVVRALAPNDGCHPSSTILFFTACYVARRPAPAFCEIALTRGRRVGVDRALCPFPHHSSQSTPHSVQAVELIDPLIFLICPLLVTSFRHPSLASMLLRRWLWHLTRPDTGGHIGGDSRGAN